MSSYYPWIGFLVGFVIGFIFNAYKLRGIPRHELRANKKLHTTYGMLNWGIAIIGALIGWWAKQGWVMPL